MFAEVWVFWNTKDLCDVIQTISHALIVLLKFIRIIILFDGVEWLTTIVILMKSRNFFLTILNSILEILVLLFERSLYLNYFIIFNFEFWSSVFGSSNFHWPNILLLFKINFSRSLTCLELIGHLKLCILLFLTTTKCLLNFGAGSILSWL